MPRAGIEPACSLALAADFKSAVSTSFTTAAAGGCALVHAIRAAILEAGVGIEPAYTDLQSAAWPLCHPAMPAAQATAQTKRGSDASPGIFVERETRLELATSTLARLRSTN